MGDMCEISLKNLDNKINKKKHKYLDCERQKKRVIEKLI